METGVAGAPVHWRLKVAQTQFVGVGVEVGVEVVVWVAVKAGVKVGEPVAVRVAVSVWVEVAVRVRVLVTDRVGVKVVVGVGLSVGVPVAVSVGLSVWVEVAVAVAAMGTVMGPHWPVASAGQSPPVVFTQLMVTVLPKIAGPQMVRGWLLSADWGMTLKLLGEMV